MPDNGNNSALIPYKGSFVEVIDPDDELIAARPAMTPEGFIEAIRRAVVAEAPPAIPEADKPALWVVAFDEWLSLSPRTGRPRPLATINAYTAAWTDFRAFHGKVDWRVTSADVKAWLDDLRNRVIDPAVARGLERNGRRAVGQIGLSDATIGQYMAAISSFYSYCETYPVILRDGRQLPLWDDINPVRARGVHRPSSKPFRDSVYLSPDQMVALLNAIWDYGLSSPSRNAKGLRDYALFLSYLLTGGRSSEIRTWRWRDLRKQGGIQQYHWCNKGKEGWDELPAPAWQAVREYLKLTGRLKNIQPDDYVFIAVTDRATRAARLSRLGPNAPAPSDGPLSGHEVGRLLKFYGKRAGMDPAPLHVHVLRHTAAMLYNEGGSDLATISRLLHHSNPAITGIYLHAMAGGRNPDWAKAYAQLPGLQSSLYEDRDE